MNITFEELRRIKHSLPHGSMTRIAGELNRDEQDIRSFFGTDKQKRTPADWHYEPGAEGGIISMRDTSILDSARRILNEPHFY